MSNVPIPDPQFRPANPPATAYAVCVPALMATVGWAPTRAWADDIAQAWLNSPGCYTHVEIWHDGLRLWSSLDPEAEPTGGPWTDHPIIDLAEQQLRAYGEHIAYAPMTRIQAVMMLPLWSHFREMSSREVAATLDRFGPDAAAVQKLDGAPESCPTCDGSEWVGRWSDVLGHQLQVTEPCPDCSACPECGSYSYRGEPCGPCLAEAEPHLGDAIARPVANGAAPVPFQAERRATDGEMCSCGRPAAVVYETERFGDVGYCGIPAGAA